MRPLLLDLFSGAGGAAMGYHRAGFDVVGVDIEPQPHYPFEFHQADALEFLERYGCEFDAIHASPPCQDHTALSAMPLNNLHGDGWMLDATIKTLQQLDCQWSVENVATAKYPPDVYRIQLCGSSFGLDVRRHRWFATNVAMMQPPCAHYFQAPRFRSVDKRRGDKLATVVGVHGHINYAGEFPLRCAAMGIDWMTAKELSQAIPPIFCQYIGEQLLAHMSEVSQHG